MGSPRSRTPDEPGAQDTAGALNLDVVGIEWIPSDDAHVFRLSFTSDREPRILKMATRGIRAVGREVGAFPAMRRLGIFEVLHFEYTDDRPDLSVEFTSRVNWQLRSRQAARWRACGSTSALVLSDVAHWLSTRLAEIEDSFGLEQNWQLPAVLVNVAGIFTGLRPFLEIDQAT